MNFSINIQITDEVASLCATNGSYLDQFLDALGKNLVLRGQILKSYTGTPVYDNNNVQIGTEYTTVNDIIDAMGEILGESSNIATPVFDQDNKQTGVTNVYTSELFDIDNINIGTVTITYNT